MFKPQFKDVLVSLEPLGGDAWLEDRSLREGL